MTEREKMLCGLPYDTSDKELIDRRNLSMSLCQKYNQTDVLDENAKADILNELLPNREGLVVLNAPIHFDYGNNTYFGKNFFSNYNFTCLDCCPVKIGDDVMIGPNVTIATPIHPMVFSERNMRTKENGEIFDIERAAPIIIEKNCWIASNVVICGGVTIGEGSVIGAGSVVTRSIPSGVFAAGNPCKVIRKITDDDLLGI